MVETSSGSYSPLRSRGTSAGIKSAMMFAEVLDVDAEAIIAKDSKNLQSRRAGELTGDFNLDDLAGAYGVDRAAIADAAKKQDLDAKDTADREVNIQYNDTPEVIVTAPDSTVTTLVLELIPNYSSDFARCGSRRNGRCPSLAGAIF